MSSLKKNTNAIKVPSSKRSHRKTLAFNDSEMAVILHFIAKYKIKNQSKFFRESIISAILRKNEEDHPTLF